MSTTLAMVGFGAALFAKEAPQAERIKALAPYFKPSFHEPLKLHPEELLLLPEKKAPLSAHGLVTISPPKGRCFIVRRRVTIPDETVCEPTTLSFQLGDINYQGRISWEVSTGKDDFGTRITWQTPYRVGHYIPAGQDDGGKTTIIVSCEARTEGYRRLVLSTMEGQKWLIAIPDEPLLMPQPDPFPNLFFTYGGRRSDGLSKAFATNPEAAGAEGATAPAPPPPPPEDLPLPPTKPEAPPEASGPMVPKEGPAKVDGQFGASFGAHFKKRKKIVDHNWTLPPRHTFEMPAGNFQIEGGPRGGEGTCRFRFRGAPHDETSGLVECISTAAFETVLAPITCGQDWEPKVKKEAPKPKPEAPPLPEGEGGEVTEQKE